MSKTNAGKILDALNNDDAAAAQVAFNHGMAKKMVDRLETSRREVGQSLYKDNQTK